MKMNAMDLAQPYPPPNAYPWSTWGVSEIPSRKKRIRLDHPANNESEQTWTGVDTLTGELPTIPLNTLGVEMQQDYHIDDEFLVFDSFNNFKQEIPSPPNTSKENHILRQYPSVEPVQKKYTVNTEQTKHEYSSLKLAVASSSTQSSYSAACNTSKTNAVNNSSSSNSNSTNISNSNPCSNTSVDVKQVSNDCQLLNKDNVNYNADQHVAASTSGSVCPITPETLDDSFRFQYVLCAATSIAMKLNEETLTYLNQGQPYEIKLKKLGDLTHTRGKIFKSIIRVLFHDRRLQYMERQQMSAWQASRPGDRILQLDLPLSYGIFDHFQDPNSLNAVQFLWDPTKDVGVYIKVNCISTEFTAKKHGGEKGVPFRIQIETYSHEKNPKNLHMASCQIKVFKLKGADRKHKQDREKIMKKSLIEREHYQNSYECTVFTDMYLNGDPLSPCGTANSSVTNSPVNTDSDGGHTNGSVLSTFDCDSNLNDSGGVDTLNSNSNITLSRESSDVEIQYWLRFNRFSSYISRFENFTINDLLSLSRDDFIQICGIPDGIRLFNALPIVSKLTMYVSTDNNSNIYHPIYLKSLTCQELISRVAPLIGLNFSQIHSSFVLGPHNSQIIITDDLVRNIKEETLYLAELCKETNGSAVINKLFLKPMSLTSSISSH